MTFSRRNLPAPTEVVSIGGYSLARAMKYAGVVLYNASPLIESASGWSGMHDIITGPLLSNAVRRHGNKINASSAARVRWVYRADQFGALTGVRVP